MSDASLRLRFSRYGPLSVNVPGFAFLVVLVGLWQLAITSGAVKFTYLPAPSSIASAGSKLVSSGALPSAILHTLIATLLGWLIGSATGLLLGLALGLSARLWRNSMSTFEVLRALPAIAFVPAAILLFGFSLKMEIVVAAYVSVWPVFINTINGVHNVTDLHYEIGRVLRLSPIARVWKIVVPSAAPPIIVALRLGLALSLALAVVAEMIGNPTGAGYAVIKEQQALQPSKMFAYIIAIGVLGILLNACFAVVVRLAFPGAATLLRETSE